MVTLSQIVPLLTEETPSTGASFIEAQPLSSEGHDEDQEKALLEDLIEFDPETDLELEESIDYDLVLPKKNRDELDRQKQPVILDPSMCYICDHRCYDTAELELHLSCHVDMLPFICKDCDTTGESQQTIVSLATLLKHFQSHSYSHKCPQCPKRFNSYRGVYSHVRDKHDPVDNPNELTCDHCDVEFDCKRKLWYHQYTLWNRKEGTFRCQFCDKCFATKSHLTRHLRLHTGAKPYSCSHCPETFVDGSALQLHRQRHINERGYGCDKCDQKFYTKALLESHKLKHIPESQRPIPKKRPPSKKPSPTEKAATHECSQCDEKFTLNYYLRQHEAIAHSDQHPYVCEACGEKFTRPATLETHRNVVHKGIREFECPECEKRFGRQDNLVTHMAVHTKARVFQCEHEGCTKAYRYKTDLNKHRRQKHGSVADGSVVFRRINAVDQEEVEEMMYREEEVVVMQDGDVEIGGFAEV